MTATPRFRIAVRAEKRPGELSSWWCACELYHNYHDWFKSVIAKLAKALQKMPQHFSAFGREATDPPGIGRHHETSSHSFFLAP